MGEVVRVKVDGSGRVKKPSKFKWTHVKDRIAVARQKALRIAGSDIRRSTQRAISSRRPRAEKLVDIGIFGGQRLVVRRKRFSLSDKVTSWKTTRNPKGFLRSDIQYDYDAASDSVVIGPTKLPRLNKMHEIGGSNTLYFARTKAPHKVARKFRGAVFGVVSNDPIGDASIKLGTRRINGRRFMQTGLKLGMDKIPKAFKDSISGP